MITTIPLFMKACHCTWRGDGVHQAPDLITLTRSSGMCGRWLNRCEALHIIWYLRSKIFDKRHQLWINKHSYLGHLARMLLCFSVACALVFGLIHPAVRHAVNVWDGGEWGRIHVAEQREKNGFRISLCGRGRYHAE